MSIGQRFFCGLFSSFCFLSIIYDSDNTEVATDEFMMIAMVLTLIPLLQTAICGC